MFPVTNFNFLGVAGNWQEIVNRRWSPNVTMNFAGNIATKREVSEEVASYGGRLGWLNEIVQALAAAAPGEVDTEPAAAGALDNVRAAQAQLGNTDKPAYASLLRSLDSDHPPGAE